MKDKKLISVIVPIYNTQMYLKMCLDSLVNQTYVNLEIILINDGSTDDSNQICNFYNEKDDRIILIDQKNSGVSKSRNLGLQIAKGDYIHFMDSDDYIELNMYEEMLLEMERYNADVVACSYCKEFENNTQYIRNNEFFETNPFTEKDALKYYFNREAYRGFGYLWNKIFKKVLFSKSNSVDILFDEDLRIGEDVLFTTELFLNAKKVYFTDKCFYHYVQREESAFHSQKYSIRKDSIIAYSKVIRILEENNVSEEVLCYVKKFIVYHGSLIATIALREKNTDGLVYCQKTIKSYLKEYEESNMNYPERIEKISQILDWKIE